MTFGERLRQLRTANNMTQESLATQINHFFNTRINKFSISRLENDYQKPTVELLGMFAQYFDVSLDYMSGGGILGADTEYSEIMAIRQEILDNPDMKILFSLTKKAHVEDVQEAIRLLQVLKRARNESNDDL